MIKIKKIIFFTIKSGLALVTLLTLVLFFYAAFFFEPSTIGKDTAENQIIKNEETSDLQRKEASVQKEPESNIEKDEEIIELPYTEIDSKPRKRKKSNAPKTSVYSSLPNAEYPSSTIDPP